MLKIALMTCCMFLVFATSVCASESFYIYNPPQCHKLTVTVNRCIKYPSINLQADGSSDNCTVDIYCTDGDGNVQYTCTHIKLNPANYDEHNGHSMYGCTCEHALVCVHSDTSPVCTPVFGLQRIGESRGHIPGNAHE